jgi:hypothetical protein
MANNQHVNSAMNKLVLASGLEMAKIRVIPKLNEELNSQIHALITRCKNLTEITVELNNMAYAVTDMCYALNRELVDNNTLAVPLGNTKFYFDADASLHSTIELLRAAADAGNRLWDNAGVAAMSKTDVAAEAKSLLNLGMDVIKTMFDREDLTPKDLRMISSVLKLEYDEELADIYNAHGTPDIIERLNTNHIDYMMMMSYLYYNNRANPNKITQAAMYVMAKSQQKVAERLPTSFLDAYNSCLEDLQHCKLPSCDARKVPAYTMTTLKCKRIIVQTSIFLGHNFTVSSVDDLAFSKNPGQAMTMLNSLYRQFLPDLTDNDIFRLGQVARNGLNGIQVNFNYCTGGIMNTVAGQPTEKYYVLMQRTGVVSCINYEGPIEKSSRNIDVNDH